MEREPHDRATAVGRVYVSRCCRSAHEGGRRPRLYVDHIFIKAPATIFQRLAKRYSRAYCIRAIADEVGVRVRRVRAPTKMTSRLFRAASSRVLYTYISKDLNRNIRSRMLTRPRTIKLLFFGERDCLLSKKKESLNYIADAFAESCEIGEHWPEGWLRYCFLNFTPPSSLLPPRPYFLSEENRFRVSHGELK